MSNAEPASMQWRKSSHSNGQANCVEVATVHSTQTWVAVQDSKVADGRCLIFTTRAWRRLVNSVQAGAGQ